MTFAEKIDELLDEVGYYQLPAAKAKTYAAIVINTCVIAADKLGNTIVADILEQAADAHSGDRANWRMPMPDNETQLRSALQWYLNNADLGSRSEKLVNQAVGILDLGQQGERVMWISVEDDEILATTDKASAGDYALKAKVKWILID